MNNILEQDICDFVSRCDYWKHFCGKRVAVTGATGLIGQILVKCLRALNNKYSLNMTIYCVVRNFEKAHKLFMPVDSSVVIVPQADFRTIESSLIGGDIHYIIHAAAPTASSYFTNNPIETYEGVVGLTHSILERAKDLMACSVVYLSSLEVYGEILDDGNEMDESCMGYINPLSARSSYSMGKRMAECLCYAYYSERQVPVKIARLAQTFGADVNVNDKRVFAYIAKSAIKHNDVVLNTPGETKHNYCYTTDAVDAILRILLFGNNGEAYNVANEQTYMSVKDMADAVLKTFSPNNHVVFNFNDTGCYPPATKVKMAVDKVKILGWKPHYDLMEMFDRLIKWYK